MVDLGTRSPTSRNLDHREGNGDGTKLVTDDEGSN